MKNFPFICPKCFVQTSVDVESPNTSAVMPTTLQCPICKCHIKVNGSIEVLPKGNPFKIDQRYII
jgi:hypothetical protein